MHRIIANLTAEFSYLEDFVSELGATDQPFAIWWNLIGFLLVGILLAAFGYNYGRVVDDRLVGICLALFGVGFAATALPIDLADSESALSKAHVVAICIGLAGWMFGSARIVQFKRLGKIGKIFYQHCGNLGCFANVWICCRTVVYASHTLTCIHCGFRMGGVYIIWSSLFT